MPGGNPSAGTGTEAWAVLTRHGLFSSSCFGSTGDKSRGFGGWPPFKQTPSFHYTFIAIRRSFVSSLPDRFFGVQAKSLFTTFYPCRSVIGHPIQHSPFGFVNRFKKPPIYKNDTLSGSGANSGLHQPKLLFQPAHEHQSALLNQILNHCPFRR